MEVFFVLFFFGLGLLAVGAFVFWVFMIIEVARIPDHQFQMGGTDKTTWILVVALTQAIGGLIWFFAKRRDVLDAASRIPVTPPGWYPEPGTQRMRWWDGARWTDYTGPSV